MDTVCKDRGRDCGTLAIYGKVFPFMDAKNYGSRKRLPFMTMRIHKWNK